MSFLSGIGAASGYSLFAVLFVGESLVWAIFSEAACCDVVLVGRTPLRSVRMCPF